VAVLPDPGSWFSSDIKVYKTVVTIDEEVSQIKPGMTAVVEIFVERLKDVLSVPVQAVVQRGSENWCFVQQSGSVVRRPVAVGKTNDKFVQIIRGIQEGDRVVLNPGALLGDEEELEPESRDRKEKSGRSSGKPSQKTADQDADPKSRPAGVGGLARFDRNGDGKLSREELPEQMQSAFDRFDKNEDGLVDAAEMQAGGLPAKSGRKKADRRREGGKSVSTRASEGESEDGEPVEKRE